MRVLSATPVLRFERGSVVVAALFLWLTTLAGATGLVGDLTGSSLWAYVFLAAWAPAIAATGPACVPLIFRSPVLWLVPALALLSVLWSQAPEVTMRSAVELAATVAMGTLTAGLVRPRAFVSAVLVALTFGAVASLAFGKFGMDGLTGTTVFMGVFASKNTLAMFMSFLAIFAAAVAADSGQNLMMRGLAAISFALAIALLLQAHSAGALVTTVMSFAVMGAAILFARLRAQERMLVLTCIGVIAIPISAAVLVLALNGTIGAAFSEFIVSVLGKDATLTGRTILWKIAIDQIAKRPLLGIGYGAFWLQGSPLPEGIWRTFQIDTRSGFTFHDTYLNLAVELGWAGVAALVATLWLTIQHTVRLMLAVPGWTNACFIAILFCLLTRSIGEVDLPAPFSIATYFIFVIASYGADHVRARRDRIFESAALVGRHTSFGSSPGL